MDLVQRTLIAAVFGTEQRDQAEGGMSIDECDEFAAA